VLGVALPAVCEDPEFDDLLYDKGWAALPVLVHLSRTLDESVRSTSDLALDDELRERLARAKVLLLIRRRRPDAGRDAEEAPHRAGTDEALRDLWIRWGLVRDEGEAAGDE
jgi:hypothetical protein